MTRKALNRVDLGGYPGSGYPLDHHSWSFICGRFFYAYGAKGETGQIASIPDLEPKLRAPRSPSPCAPTCRWNLFVFGRVRRFRDSRLRCRRRRSRGLRGKWRYRPCIYRSIEALIQSRAHAGGFIETVLCVRSTLIVGRHSSLRCFKRSHRGGDAYDHKKYRSSEEGGNRHPVQGGEPRMVFLRFANDIFEMSAVSAENAEHCAEADYKGHQGQNIENQAFNRADFKSRHQGRNNPIPPADNVSRLLSSSSRVLYQASTDDA